MGSLPNRSGDLSASGERARKHRGTDVVTKGHIGNVTIPEPDEAWGSTAKMIWDSGLESGASDFYSSADFAYLHFTCSQVDHIMGQGGRRSPELLRVISTMLGSLLFTESDRRRVRVELDRTEDSSAELALVVGEIFKADDVEETERDETPASA